VAEYESPNGAEPAGWIGVSESPRQLEPDFNDVPISRDDTLRTGRDTNPVILEPIDRIRSHLHEDDRGSDNKGLKRLAQSKISWQRGIRKHCCLMGTACPTAQCRPPAFCYSAYTFEPCRPVLHHPSRDTTSTVPFAAVVPVACATGYKRSFLSLCFRSYSAKLAGQSFVLYNTEQ
jgi:hypothetical protein